MSASLRVVCIWLVALALLSSLAARAAPVLPQWQPQFSQQGLDPDPRLEHAVTLALPASDLATVIAELAKQSGVALACADDLRSRPITIYLPGTRLKDVMAELASFVMCEWWKEGNPPRYTLRKTNSLRQAEQAALTQALAPRTPERPPQHSPEEIDALMARIQEEAAALALSDDALIARYEESDPWLAAALLSSVNRQVISFLAALPRDEIESIANGPHPSVRVSDLPTAMREHVERWVNGAYPNALPSIHGPSGPVDWREPYPGHLNRFATWEERWRFATLNFGWDSSGLYVWVDVPDARDRPTCQPICTQNPGSLSYALSQIFEHQTPNPTAEQRAAFAAWVTPLSMAASARAEQEAAAREAANRLESRRRMGVDWSDGEALARRCVVWPFARTATTRAGRDELLVRVAAATRLPLLADADPYEDRAWISEEMTRERTLREVLKSFSQSGWLTCSKPQGRFLAVYRGWNPQDRTPLSMGAIPAHVLARWDEATRGRSVMTLQQYLWLAADLTPAQRVFGLAQTKWRGAAEDFNRAYQYLSGRIGYRLLTGEEVPIQDLGEQAWQWILERAVAKRPWMTESDLQRATLTLLRRPSRVSGLPPTVTVVCNYHFPDGPTDRDFLTGAPVWTPILPLPDQAKKLTHPLPPFPEPTSSAQAALDQTNWLYRGNVTIDGKRSAMLTDDSTGEMELLEVGRTFRGLTVSGIRDSGVTLTDPAGATVLLTTKARAPADPALWGDK